MVETHLRTDIYRAGTRHDAFSPSILPEVATLPAGQSSKDQIIAYAAKSALPRRQQQGWGGVGAKEKTGGKHGVLGGGGVGVDD